MSEKEISQSIDVINELLVKIENYIKVTDYEGYRQVNKLLQSIDYFSLDYLKKAENSDLKDQLRYDCRMMVRARMKNDFREFCRYASLQVELLIDEFILKMEEFGQIEILDREYDKPTEIKILSKNEQLKIKNIQQKIDFCLASINVINSNKSISLIFKIRNLGSHRDKAMLRR
ncbi:hypothetical protein [Synechocystis sp. CACIAM 05]|uniref:hypothetical protein n=1 Tax=Synechocystis sp. CACIAM 05 TaxID=1933929 RepID=UPI00138E7863|nr:hypothetical protein [Synechocystis sp. CACIAM 05]QHV00597.1 hypothetical protein BWK47_10990 [Synechocystis sp. CACIAM 05]